MPIVNMGAAALPEELKMKTNSRFHRVVAFAFAAAVVAWGGVAAAEGEPASPVSVTVANATGEETLSTDGATWLSSVTVEVQPGEYAQVHDKAGFVRLVPAVAGTYYALSNCTGMTTDPSAWTTVRPDGNTAVIFANALTSTFLPGGSYQVSESLVVGGGGAGGNTMGGGGGGGGVVFSNETFGVSAMDAFAVTVGGGGTKGGTAQQAGTAGGKSELSLNGLLKVSARGGGGGGGWGDKTGKGGGSGGGGSNASAGGAGTAGQGFDGAAALGADSRSGGGGGAGGPGQQADEVAKTAGRGGLGFVCSITGTARTYGAGGGGGGSSDKKFLIYDGGAGGGEGAGSGGKGSAGTAGLAGTGGGGGGGGWTGGNQYGGAGGSGTVVLALVCTDPGVTVAGDPDVWGADGDPKYGNHVMDDGEERTFTAPPTVYLNDGRTVRAVCQGYRMDAFDPATQQWGLGEATNGSLSCTYVQSGTERRRLTWIWQKQVLVAITNATGDAVLSLDGGETWFAMTNAWLELGSEVVVTVREDVRRMLDLTGPGASVRPDGSYAVMVPGPVELTAAPQEGGTRRWKADYSGLEYLVTVTNFTGEAVALHEGSSVPEAAFSMWVGEGEDFLFSTEPADGRRIAFFDEPTNFVLGADCASGRLSSVRVSATVRLASFTPDYVWTGEASTLYEQEDNWVTAGGEIGGCPGPDSVVFIPEGAAQYPESSAAVVAKSLFVGSLTNGAGTASLTVNHKSENVISNDLFVFSGGKLTHGAVGAKLEKLDSEDRKLIVRVHGNAVIAGGGSLDAVGMGFATNMGPGKCPPNGDQTRAAHGGSTWVGYCYGSVTCPTNCGSGGNYGPGGGAIQLTVDGACHLFGAINANSPDANGGRCSGSGGSAWLTCATLCGTGTVSATAGITSWAGSGSGGRVAVYVRRDSTGFTGTLEANPGYNLGHKSTFGGPGTVYFERETDAPGRGTVYVRATNVLKTKGLGASYWNTLGFCELPSMQVGSVVVTDLARVQGRTDATIDLTGSWRGDGGRVNAFNGTLRLSGAADAVVTGTNSFAKLLCEEPGKRLTFGSAADEGTVVGEALVLKGTAESPLSLAGADGGTWRLSLSEKASVDVRSVAVAGSDASAGPPVVAYASQDGDPACVNWNFLEDPQPGDEIVWTGAQSSSWFDSRNWNPARVPMATDAVTIEAADRAPVLEILGVTLNSLTISSGATLTLDGADLAVTNALVVRGSLACTQFERVTAEGTVDFAGGAFAPVFGTFVLGGELAQTVDFAGVTLANLLVRKPAGSVAFAHGFGATTFDFSACGAVTMAFAANETVMCAEFACADGTLVSSAPGTPWMLNVTGAQAVQRTTVTDSHATGIAIYADALSRAVSGCDRWYFGSVARTWTGGGAAGAWNDPANWSPAGEPDTSSRVTIENASVTVSGAAVAQNVTLGAGASLAVALGASLACEDGFEVRSGATATLDGPLTVTNAVIVRGGGLVTHSAQPAKADAVKDEKYRVTVFAGGAITVEANGAIDATEKGYAAGKGPGKSTSGFDGSGRACHGGGYNPGCCYGSMLCPTNCGTGHQSSGGGAIRLVTGGTLRVDGTVAADAGASPTATGSGAGGSVWVTAARLAGYGTLRADGGYSKNYYTGCGGRVAVYLTEATDFAGWTGEIHARAGAGGGYSLRQDGCSGTVYLQTADQADRRGTVILENLGASTVEGGCSPMVEMKAACQSDEVGTIIVTNATRISVPAGETLKVYGDWRFGQAFSSLSGEVRFCGTNDAHVCGSATFKDLTCEVPGKTLYFGTGASDEVKFANGGQARFVGTEEEPVNLLPETPDGSWLFTLTTDCKHKIMYACVSNSNANAGLPVTAEDSHNLGGNQNWGFVAEVKPGAPIYWCGEQDSSWTVTENWRDAGGNCRAPVDTDEIIIRAGCPNWPVMESGTKVQNAFRVDSGAEFTIRDCTLYATNAFVSEGTVRLEGNVRVVCSNAVALTGSTLLAGPQSVFRLEGPTDQSVDPAGCAFHRFEIEKNGGSVTFGDGLAADAFDVLTKGPVRLAFAPGRTVEADEMVVRGQTNGTEGVTWPLALASAASGQRWYVRVRGLQYFSGVDVSDSEALGAEASADGLSHDGDGNENWAFGEDRVAWTGAKNTSFTEPANWYPPRVPGPDATVLMTARAGETKSVSASTAIQLNNLCVGAGLGKVTFTCTGPLTLAGSLEVCTNGTVSLNSTEVPNVVSGDVFVGVGGLLTHEAISTKATAVEQQDRRLWLNVLGNMTVASGGAVDAAAKGFSGRTGPATVDWGMYWYGDHAGVRVAGTAYGSAYEPVTCGSGGNGGAGGGEIRLDVVGTLTVNGNIRADGAAINASPAGGTVNVRCGALAGDGTLSANGGDCVYYGSGGGGRVAVRVSASMAAFTGTCEAGGGYVTGHLFGFGGAGTVYVQGPGEGEGYGTITIDNGRLRKQSKFNPSESRYWTELPLAEPTALGARPYKNASLVIGDLADVRLTDDMIVKDLDILSGSARLRLQGHVLTVRTIKHKNARGWADVYENLVIEDGGRVEWKPSGTLIVVR